MLNEAKNASENSSHLNVLAAGYLRGAIAAHTLRSYTRLTFATRTDLRAALEGTVLEALPGIDVRSAA